MIFNPIDNMINVNINNFQDDTDHDEDDDDDLEFEDYVESNFNHLALGDFQSTFNTLLRGSGMSFDAATPGYAYPRPNQSKESTYYSIETTENPYILKYTQCALENLGDRFIVYPPGQTIHDGRSVYNDWNKGIWFVLDETFIKETLEAYKKQLDASPKNHIEDIHLTTFNNPSGYNGDLSYFIQDWVKEFGLRRTKEGKFALALPKKEPKEPKVAQSDINSTLSHMINNHIRRLGLHGSFRIYSSNLVATLKFFKLTVPNLTYDEILSKTPYVTDLKGVREIWNNPDSFKPKSSKEKK